MNRIFIVCVLSLIVCNYQKVYSQIDTSLQNKGINQVLFDELKGMVEIDQLAANNAFPPEKYKHLTQNNWEELKDSIFRTHKVRLEKILNDFGYPGYSLVGKVGENDFWLMVQHCDFDVDFQLKVLRKLEIEVKNKNGGNFAFLTDRVKINTGDKQIFGTQLKYNSIGQAYPVNLSDSVNVDKRRAEVGLEPIKIYLNMMTEMHFEMNKDYYMEKGIKTPILYKVENK
jgi:hypothetical protein